MAMTSEYGLVKSLLEQTKEESVCGLLFTEGHIGNVEVILVKSGIGKVCAAVGTMEMIQHYAPDIIVNTGVAGGIDPLTQVMDIVVGENMVYHDVWCGEGNEYGQVVCRLVLFRIRSCVNWHCLLLMRVMFTVV